MPLLTLEQCRAHCRIDGDFDDAILGDLLAAASDAAAAYLGRELADQAALDQALDQLQDMAAAVTGHEAAVAAANAETNAPGQRPCVMWPIVAWPWRPRAVRLLLGMPTNDSIRAAVRLLLGHLYAHREAVVVSARTFDAPAGATAIAMELPFGVAALLDPYQSAATP